MVTDIVDAVNDNADDAQGRGRLRRGRRLRPGDHAGPRGCGQHGVRRGDRRLDVRPDRGAAPTRTSTRSSPATPTSPTTTRCRCQAWIDEDRAVTERPVVSAGQYGANLNRLEFEFAPGTDDLVDIRQTVAPAQGLRRRPGHPGDRRRRGRRTPPPRATTPLGDIEDPFQRARRTDPDNGGAVVENRGGESTLGNLVAEIQRWKTGADLAFMNPGGLRADLNGTRATRGPDLPAGRGRPAVRQHPGDDGPHRRRRSRRSSSSSGSATPTATSRRARSCGSAPPTGSRSPRTPRVPRATGSPASGWTASRSTPTRPTGSRRLVPRVRHR